MKQRIRQQVRTSSASYCYYIEWLIFEVICRIPSWSSQRVIDKRKPCYGAGSQLTCFSISRKLARLRAQLLEPTGGGGGGGQGFDVSKSGDARVALVGFPSVGKSTFLSKITKTKSEAASYAFTTLTAIPGVLEYGGAEIQILDLPGIIEGAAEGKGRGRQVISAAKVKWTLAVTSFFFFFFFNANIYDTLRQVIWS